MTAQNIFTEVKIYPNYSQLSNQEKVTCRHDSHIIVNSNNSKVQFEICLSDYIAENVTINLFNLNLLTVLVILECHQEDTLEI